MRGINKVILVGTLGQDPDVRQTITGKNITNISIATSENWTNKDGLQTSKTEWHRVVFFDKLADIAAQYLRKGSKVYVEGRLQTNKWTDKDGNNRSTTEIVVASFNGALEMLDSKPNNNSQENNFSQNRYSNNQLKNNFNNSNAGSSYSAPTNNAYSESDNKFTNNQKTMNQTTNFHNSLEDDELDDDDIPF